MYKTADGKLEEEKSFFDVEAYGNIGVFASTVKTGQGIRLVGRLKQKRWKDSDGKELSKVVVLAEHIELKPVKEEK
jgi:single-strand DNA-binding protein